MKKIATISGLLIMLTGINAQAATEKPFDSSGFKFNISGTLVDEPTFSFGLGYETRKNKSGFSHVTSGSYSISDSMGIKSDGYGLSYALKKKFDNNFYINAGLGLAYSSFKDSNLTITTALPVIGAGFENKKLLIDFGYGFGGNMKIHNGYESADVGVSALSFTVGFKPIKDLTVYTSIYDTTLSYQGSMYKPTTNPSLGIQFKF